MFTEPLTHTQRFQFYLAQWEKFLCTVNSTLFTATALMSAQDLQYVQPAGKSFKTIHAKKKKKNLQCLQTLSQLFCNEMQSHQIIFLLL